MAPPPGQLRTGKYFLTLAVLIAGLYALVFFAGPSGSWHDKLTPKLGLDLQGGTTVTLKAALPGGGVPKKDQLEEARQIIENRVNGSGVAEFEVLVEGDRNLVVNVPGSNDEDLKRIGQPAQLRFREVLNQAAAVKPPKDKPVPAAKLDAPPPVRDAVIAKFSPQAQQAVKTAAESKTAIDFNDPEIAKLFEPVYSLTPAEIAVLPADYQFYIPNISCEVLNKRPPGSIVTANENVVACKQKDEVKSLLENAKVLGTDVKTASFGYEPQMGWVVSIKFTGKGQDRWTNLTKATVGKQVAVVLDNVVVSDPSINEAIPGDAQISGSGISKSVAKDIANKLKYGALPLSFSTENTYSISPTLGIEQLKAGLLAGGIGLILVVVYSLLYYRALGFVTITSLIASGVIVYACVVLLGRQIGFTLTLAGVAGFIVAIGITADSFVVFFEYLKDEVKEGRSVRSAVPRAWVRARRTILSADAVSFLGAAVLYILSIGAVKGFAFTLGLSTLVDVVIVFLFTHPLVALLSRSKAFGSPRFSGLANARTTPASAPAPGRGRLAVAKES